MNGQDTMRNGGFTLMELMIAVAIVGILATIAYPSYQDYVYKSRRTDAYNAISKVQFEQEKLRANCKFYAQDLAGANSCAVTAADTDLGTSLWDGANATSPEGYYTVTIAAGTASGNAYTVSADPRVPKRETRIATPSPCRLMQVIRTVSRDPQTAGINHATTKRHSNSTGSPIAGSSLEN